MPGINKILTRTTGNSSKILYDFVEKYEHFYNIKRKGEQKFIKEYSAWSKKKWYRNGAIKALKIYELENYREALEIIKSLEEVSGEIIEVYFFKALIYKALAENDKYEGLKVILEEKNMMFFKILESMESLEE